MKKVIFSTGSRIYSYSQIYHKGAINLSSRINSWRRIIACGRINTKAQINNKQGVTLLSACAPEGGIYSTTRGVLLLYFYLLRLFSYAFANPLLQLLTLTATIILILNSFINNLKYS